MPEAAVADQADGLRRLIGRRRLRVLPVLGDPADAASAACVVGLACASSGAGRRTYVLDEGAGGIAAALGLTWRAELADLLEGRRDIAQVVLPGPCGVGIVPARKGVAALLEAGASGADLFEGFAQLSARPDLVIFHLEDAGAARLLPEDSELLVLARPGEEALTGAYARIKRLVQGGRPRMRLLVHGADAGEGNGVHAQLAAVARRFLAADLLYAGHIERDPALAGGGARSAPRLTGLFQRCAEGLEAWRLPEYGTA